MTAKWQENLTVILCSFLWSHSHFKWLSLQIQNDITNMKSIWLHRWKMALRDINIVISFAIVACFPIVISFTIILFAVIMGFAIVRGFANVIFTLSFDSQAGGGLSLSPLFSLMAISCSYGWLNFLCPTWEPPSGNCIPQSSQVTTWGSHQGNFRLVYFVITAVRLSYISVQGPSRRK